MFVACMLHICFMYVATCFHSDVANLISDTERAKRDADAFLGALAMGPAGCRPDEPNDFRSDGEHEAKRRRTEDCSNLAAPHSAAPYSGEPQPLDSADPAVEKGPERKTKRDLAAMIDGHADGQADGCAHGHADRRRHSSVIDGDSDRAVDPADMPRAPPPPPIGRVPPPPPPPALPGGAAMRCGLTGRLHSTAAGCLSLLVLEGAELQECKHHMARAALSFPGCQLHELRPRAAENETGVLSQLWQLADGPEWSCDPVGQWTDDNKCS